MHINQQKKELRYQLKLERLKIPAHDKKKNDEKIRQFLFKTNTFRLADSLLIYYSINEEVSTPEIITEALDRKIVVYLPKCFKDENGNDSMLFYEINSLSDLSAGMYNIPEPSQTSRLFTQKGHCLCIVPGLAFDKNGCRIGYGKGYYDRFLKDFTGTKVGLCYEPFLKESIPTSKYDSKVDMIITEKGIYVPNAK